MTDIDDLAKAIFAEFDRLGLDINETPARGGMAASPGGAEALLERLRGLQPGVTWHDVDPGMPAHWVMGRPETWTSPYRSLGAFDFPKPPAGAAIIVFWDKGGASPPHAALVQRAIQAGWPVRGGAVTSGRSAAHMDNIGFIVLELGTSEKTLDDMCQWVVAQPGVENAYPERHENEEYAPDPA